MRYTKRRIASTVGKQIKDLPELTTASDTDKLVIQTSSGVTKYITRANFLAGISTGGSTGGDTVETTLLDSPIIYYNFSETTGTTANDLSGNSRNGTYNGNYVLNQPGKKTGDIAVNLNSAGYVSIPDFTNTSTSWSVEAIIKSSSTIAIGDAVIFDSSNPRLIFTYANFGDGGLAIYDGAYHVFGLPPSDDSWHHFLFVANGVTSQCYLFKDGVKSTVLGYTPTAIGTGVKRIGANFLLAGSGSFLKLPISTFALYDTALTDTKVAEHYADYLA